MNKIIVRSPEELTFDGKTYRCVVGKEGVTTNKKEGDQKTPVGTFKLRCVYYRPDKFPSAPQTELQAYILSENDLWCDDSNHPDTYNRHVMAPHGGSFEKLWRSDDSYDLIIPMGYNDGIEGEPNVPGEGSAIFMHVA